MPVASWIPAGPRPRMGWIHLTRKSEFARGIAASLFDAMPPTLATSSDNGNVRPAPAKAPRLRNSRLPTVDIGRPLLTWILRGPASGTPSMKVSRPGKMGRRDLFADAVGVSMGFRFARLRAGNSARLLRAADCRGAAASTDERTRERRARTVPPHVADAGSIDRR